MTAGTPWLTSRKPNPKAGVRLFCFPYGGGGDSIFRSWQKGLPETIEVCPVQLPGRGPRISEPPFTELGPLVRAAAQALTPHLDRPFAFFGHSMGALVGFKLARHLRRDGGQQPVHLFVSGRCSPQTPREPFAGDLPDSDFSEILRRSNGTPEEVLEDPELMELLLPVIRADFAVSKSYVYAPGPPFSFPVTAFGGLEDPGVSRECIEGWREHTTGPFVLRMLPGDHFFLNTSTRPLLEAIAKELERDVKCKGE
ncbi:MAG TPA: thioesterase II family protein [Pyrinomonadaceae bacterium]|jgi:medium-chain acyl-[acyl-carrier-protein] hydrolase|nr:thioesterase II family protein [Pyrinomonadaceae bacterium]